MNFTTTFFPFKTGVGYSLISDDGSVKIQQEYTPGAAGFVLMTQTDAEYYASLDISRSQPQG